MKNDISKSSKKTLTEDKLRAKVFKASRIIESHYAQPLKVSQLAKEVGLSVSHFHLAFQSIVGESVMQHILRIRLEHAASLLTYSSWQAGDIGFACGFQSAANFSRSFKHHFGVSPQQFRNDENTLPFLRGYFRSRPEQELHNSELKLPTVRLEDWLQLHAICLRFYGRVNDIYKPWMELIGWAKGNLTHLQECRFLGLWFDDWSGQDDLHYRYECAIITADVDTLEIPEPYFIRKIPAGKVAVATTLGTLSAIDRAWRAFGTGWLPFSGYQPRENFFIDEYNNDFMLKPSIRKFTSIILGKIEMDMCIPIQSGSVGY
jgi:AraC family transcriptional regulator